VKYLTHASFIREVCLPFKAEYDKFLDRSSGDGLFSFDNTLFGSVDAEVLYSVIRYRKPELVVEIGAGWSTLLIREAIHENGPFGRVESHDPDPPDFLKLDPGVNLMGAAGITIGALKPGDVLFVDGSHIWQPGSDVALLFTMILPSLPDGVWVHLHDIFLPDPYPESWSDRGYDEQDALLKFLEANPEWSVLFSSHHAQSVRPESLVEAFASYDESKWPGSFWMRKRG
jgi:hypothetical protein